jgi:plastocyanin
MSIASAVVPFSAHAGGSVTGKISFQGAAPERKQVKMDADPKCAAANPQGRLGEVFVINGDALQNVFVYVKDGLGDKKFDLPAEAVVIDQNGCMYSPHVLGAMVGQTLEIRNSDATLHNVHSLPKNSPQFNSAMPMKGMTIKKKFGAAEVMVKIKCDVHPWMSAYIGVLDHPFYAVSGADGTFKINNLPAGTYTIEAWHESLGSQTTSVTVAEGGAATADFAFKPQS